MFSMIKVTVLVPDKGVAFVRGMFAAWHNQVQKQLTRFVDPELLHHTHVYKRSHRNGGWDHFMSWLGRYPWRCAQCRKRYYLRRRI